MSNSRLPDLLALSIVPRWSIVPHLRFQSVAEHSFRVAAIALELCNRLNGEGGPTAQVIEWKCLRWAIIHDGPESETGDIPYPVKKAIPDGVVMKAEWDACPWYEREYSAVHPPEFAIVKIADKIEEAAFLTQWGHGEKAQTALADAWQQIIAHAERARSRFGLVELPRIVKDMLKELGVILESQPQPGGKLQMVADDAPTPNKR